MATNKIHFLVHLLFPEVYSSVVGDNKMLLRNFFGPKAAAVVMANDSIRCWLHEREFGHFTLNSATRQISWCMFPDKSIRKWKKQDIQMMPRFFARQIANAVIDAASIPSEMWGHNEKTPQNKKLFLHLIQDRSYDRFVRSVINCRNYYDDEYEYNGQKLSSAQLRGKEGERGLLDELDDGFYVRMAKRYFYQTGIKADRRWMQEVMLPAIKKAYSNELYQEVIPFVTISDKANDLIANEKFDEECWPAPNWLIDSYITWMMEDMYDALIELKVVETPDEDNN